jgi:PAS domain S-box-containing protein
LNGNPPTIPAGGLTLSVVSLRVPHDLVSLRRHTRAAAEQFGLDPADVRSFSAATYETARLLLDLSDTARAEVRVADDPCLQVVITAEAAEAEVRAALLAHTGAGVSAVRALVDVLSIDESSSGVIVALTRAFPNGGPGHDGCGGARYNASEAVRIDRDSEQGDIRAEHAALQRAFAELQTELQETNRGVVALYAELEDRAERLRHAEDRLRLLLDSVQDYAICMLSDGGEIASWNAGAERLFGYSAAEIIGRHVSCFYVPAESDAGVPADHMRAARDAGRLECECQRVRRGGSAFDAHVVLTPVYAHRELRGFSLVVRDVTERKRLEDDLRRRADDLAAANRAKEDFLATLSHELRTPLNAMLGWTRLLRSGKLDPAAMARALETIERNAHIQEQLIADILDVSRIVTGKLRLELRPTDLIPILDAAVDTVSPGAEAKGVRLTVDARFSGEVLGDPDRLQQVIWNLLANAIKFTPGGGLVRISLARVGRNAVVTVADTGEGIAPTLLPFVFDRFIQGDASVTRPHGGLGLGLSIVRHIVELHGGTVHAWSEGQGKGSTFSVHLPVRAVQRAGGEALGDSPQHSLS